MDSIKINGLDIKIPANMSVSMGEDGSVIFIPITPKHKTVHIDKHGQKITTASLAQTVRSGKALFLSTEELKMIRVYFIAKGGCVSREDADTLADQSGIPVRKIGYRFNKLRQQVCYGYMTVPDTDAFQASLQANGGWMANLYTDPKVMAKREATLRLAKVFHWTI